MESHWGRAEKRQAVRKVIWKVRTQTGTENHLVWIKTCPTERLRVLSHSVPWGSRVRWQDRASQYNKNSTNRDWLGRFWSQLALGSPIQDKVHIENVCVEQDTYLYWSHRSVPSDWQDKKRGKCKNFTPIPAFCILMWALLLANRFSSWQFWIHSTASCPGFLVEESILFNMFYRSALRATMSSLPLRY